MMVSSAIPSSWLVDQLACPKDREPVHAAGTELVCESGHRFPVVDGVPVMLDDALPPAMAGVEGSLRRARGEVTDERAPGLYLESLGISDEEKRGVVDLARRGGPIDPVVAYLVAATNGLLYRRLVGRLDRYPLPDLPLPAGEGRLLVDVGCGWGRWSLAASAKGYRAIGVDPSLGAVMAARRVAAQLGAPAHFVVGDARCLPLRSGRVDVTYSYSVLQHLPRRDAARAVEEMARVLGKRGVARVQMPTRLGVRCLYHQARRGFREGAGFDVRYWSRAELVRLFAPVGRAAFEADGYLGIGLQAGDRALMGPGRRLVLLVSETLKRASRRVPALVGVADSVLVTAVKEAGA